MTHPARDKLEAIVKGLGDVPPGKWSADQTGVVVCVSSDGDRTVLAARKSDVPLKHAAHIARCDPDTMREIADYVRTLQEENQALRKANEWQPIETAPKGARGIAWMMLAYGPEGDQSVSVGLRFNDQFFAAGTFYNGGPFDGRQFNFREHEVAPTHWMPLHAAPILQSKRTEAGE